MLSWVSRNALTVVALFAYFMMSLMLLGQSRIIDSQRTLIRQLYADSQELTAAKVNQLTNKHKKSDATARP